MRYSEAKWQKTVMAEVSLPQAGSTQPRRQYVVDSHTVARMYVGKRQSQANDAPLH